MKPSFALHITDTAIGLLHRTARGWLKVGETAFDTADLAEALGYLRGSALGLSPGGLTTKLVLPNSQIKYLELEAVGPSDNDRRNQIRAALVGKTPYNVEDLVFDWSGSGTRVQVAVVARETLYEAEAFATEHRFNPVSFVGLPLKGDFKGEPWFGPTKASVSLLEKGEKVDRDAEVVQIAGRDLPKSHPGAAKTSSSGGEGSADTALTKNDKQPRDKGKPARNVDDVADAGAPVVAERDQPVVRTGTAPVADVAAAAAPDISDTSDVGRTFADPTKADQPAAPTAGVTQSVTRNQAFLAEDGPAIVDDVPPAPSAAIMAAFASRRGAEPAATTPRSAMGSGVATPPPTPLGGSDLADRLAGKSAPPPLSRPVVAADLPRTAAVQVPAGPPSLEQAAPISGVTPSASETAKLKAVAGKANTAFVTAPNIPGARKRKTSQAEAVTVGDAAGGRKSLTKPGGTFASSKQRGKPRYLGLILTGLLLLFLALIAAWSSFFLASNTATSSGTEVVDTPQAVAVPTETAADVATVDVPAIDDEMLADGQDVASLAPETAPLEAAPVPEAVPETPLVANVPADVAVPAADTTVSATNTPEPAPVVAASTDAPNSVPLTEAQDEIFLTTIDAPPLVLDPLALPQPIAENDALPLPQLEPPPFGTVYQFDADGRILATPEGIVTPEGVRLVAGKPSITPPARPDAVVTAAQPAALPDVPAVGGTIAATGAEAAVPAVAVPFPSDPALADARPRSRPASLAAPTQQTGDGASLLTPAQARVAGLRPQARPAAILAAGEAARQSTANASLAAQAEQAAAVEAAVVASVQSDPNASRLAVAVSRRPAARPKDMSRAVEAAVAAAVRAPEPKAEEPHLEADAEPELASAAPAIPTRASVAKQATYVNAINLSKINLIGVYGSKSKPYALIRQANGRYKKVKVGDSIDGGKVAAIGPSEVRYQKSGRMISLKMPRT